MTQTMTSTELEQVYSDLEAAAQQALKASIRSGKGLMCSCYMKTAEDCVTDCLRWRQL